MSKWWDMWFVYRCPTDGGRDGLRWPALSGHWLLCTGCWLCLLSMKLLMGETPFLHIFTPLGCFCSRTIFTKNNLDMLPIWDLHTILKTTSIGVPSLATDSPCGIWGRGWTAPAWWSTFSSNFELSVGVNVWCDEEDFFPLISWVYSCFIHYPNFT